MLLFVSFSLFFGVSEKLKNFTLQNIPLCFHVYSCLSGGTVRCLEALMYRFHLYRDGRAYISGGFGYAHHRTGVPGFNASAAFGGARTSLSDFWGPVC